MASGSNIAKRNRSSKVPDSGPALVVLVVFRGFYCPLTAFLLPYTAIIDSMKIRKGRRNSRLRQPLQCRGDWIRTSDLLNPIQELAGRKIARASRFTAYSSHTSHTLRSGTHRIHEFQGVSCSFLHNASLTTTYYCNCRPRISV